MKKTKFYVVWVGRKPGIYATWDECEKQVARFVDAKYKAFSTREEAEIAFRQGTMPKDKPTPVRNTAAKQYPKGPGIVVDAACSGVPGPVEWRAVELAGGKEILRSDVYQHGTNNIGEFLAIVDGIRWLMNEKKDWPIYSDSYNGALWVKKKKCNTNLARTRKNEPLFLRIEDAEQFLASHELKVKIKKWETADWGENPADFGRK